MAERYKKMRTLPMTINARWLKKWGACEDQHDKFCIEWPNGAKVTITNLHRSATLGLDLEWFAKIVLPLPIYGEYEAKCVPIITDYRATRFLIWGDYKAKLALLNAKIVAIKRKRETRHDQPYEKYDVTRAPRLELDYAAKRMLYAEVIDKLNPSYVKSRDKRDALIISFICEYYTSKGLTL